MDRAGDAPHRPHRAGAPELRLTGLASRAGLRCERRGARGHRAGEPFHRAGGAGSGSTRVSPPTSPLGGEQRRAEAGGHQPAEELRAGDQRRRADPPQHPQERRDGQDPPLDRRHGVGHPQGGDPAHLRPVLHDEGQRRGHGARAVRRLWNRHEVQGRHRREEPRRPGSALHAEPALPSPRGYPHEGRVDPDRRRRGGDPPRAGEPLPPGRVHRAQRGGRRHGGGRPRAPGRWTRRWWTSACAAAGPGSTC